MNRTRRAFDYTPPSFEEAQKLSERRGGRFDGLVKQDGPRFFRAKTGDNFIRILPPSWENARHYALEVKIHRNIGPDKQSYLCLKENEYSPEKDCPLCEERHEMTRRKTDQKLVDELRPQSSTFIYMIDRANESQGPQIWGMSNKNDAEILSQSMEKRQHIYLPIAHPIDGYDVEFVREGEGLNTRYRGFKVARASSPITDDADKLDEWLNYIDEHPIPDILQFFPADRIKLVYYGKGDTHEEEDRPTRVRDEVREPPARTAREEAEPNGHDEEPPFDTTQGTTTRRTLDEVPSERPSPRQTAAEPAERKRATLNPPGDNSPEDRKERLRAQLARRSEQ